VKGKKRLYERIDNRESGSDKLLGVMSLEAKVVVLGTQGWFGSSLQSLGSIN